MEAVFVVDRATASIISANARAADMLGRDLAALLGTPLAAAMAEPERDVLPPGHYEDVALRGSDGEPLYVDLDVVHVDVPDRGEVAAYMARDTSERRLLQRELVGKHTALVSAHAALERAHAQLSATKRELETRNQEIALLAWRAAMGELVAGIAHHLNNPVGALASTLRRMTALLADVPLPQRPEVERLLVRVSQIARRIESNVSAIVHATKATERGAPPRELPPELAAVLSTFVEKLDEIQIKEHS